MGDDTDDLDAIREALGVLGMLDDDLTEDIVEQVRDAIGRLSHGPDGDGADVVVLRGGRDEKDEPPPAERPRFEVLQGEGAAANSRVNVRVLPGRPAMVNLDLGHVRLPGDPDVWQTLAHGTTAAVYRVHCDLGELMVSANGELVARLETGQSIDVEAAIVRARSCSEAPARGRYVRLR